MQIEKIQINNFGKLKNKNIELKNGINVISGKNESGKSTLLKFITSMLYGINKNKNGKRISDFEKYTPWQEGEFSGKITYKLDNNERYEVYRNFAKKNPQILDNNGNDVSKNYIIDKTSGNQFFFEQTKVDEELFNTTMVIMQQEVKLDEKQQNSLIQKASNIMLTGEDDISYKKILSKLNKKQTEEIGTEKSPTKPMYQIKQKIAELENKKEELEEVLPLQYEIEDKKKNIEEEIASGEKELELLQEIKNIQNVTNLENEKIELNISAKKEIENKKEEEKTKLENIKTEKVNKKSYKMLYIISILLIIFTIILFTIKQKVFAGVVLIADIISIIVVTLIQTKENKKYNKQKEEERQEKNSIRTRIELLENEINEKEKNIKEKQEELENKININKAILRSKYPNVNDIEKILEKDVTGGNILAEQRYINDLKLENSKIDMQKEDILERLEQISSIEEELENSKENLEELLKYNKAIDLAKEALEKAYTKMRENITPKFTDNLSNTINDISSGKYKTVKVNEEAGLIVETENGNYVPADVLSIGTIDELYLSLRISSIKEFTKEDMPIILDETFAYFDSERLENVLKYLNTEYRNNQIIILTCTNRENEILQKIGVRYNQVEI